MRAHLRQVVIAAGVLALGIGTGCDDDDDDDPRDPMCGMDAGLMCPPCPTPDAAALCPGPDGSTPQPSDPSVVNGMALVEEGREIFRFDTFGDKVFWGGQLRLHEAVAGEANGGVGPGLTPTDALGLGLKVDATALPEELRSQLAAGEVDLNDPATTLALLQIDSVVGVKGFFDEGGALTSIGITCAFCHSTVDDSFAPGIGERLDGWPNRDLDVGGIVALAPTLQPFVDVLGVDEATVRTVLDAWGPGRYDAMLILDGQGFRPDGATAAVLLPAAFGLAGVNLHTYTGFGGVPYWNAHVAIIQMHGQGRFYDPRLNDAERFPVAAANGFADIRPENDLVTSKLPALHVYQLAIPIPTPPADRFDAAAAERGRAIFEGRAQCATCHVPPIYTEPGHNLHTPEEIGIDSFQADRSPTESYRTTPLGGLFTREEGGFYHDGRFATLGDVVDHYDAVLGLGLTAEERADLIEFLRSL